MNKRLSASYIGPSGLPTRVNDVAWCPDSLRARAWSEWRERGLPTRGVEDYLYLDWRRLNSVSDADNPQDMVVEDATEISGSVTLRNGTTTLRAGQGCQVMSLDDAEPEFQSEIAARLERLVESSDNGLDLLRISLLSNAVLIDVAAETRADCELHLELDGNNSIFAPLIVTRVGPRGTLTLRDKTQGSDEATSLALPLSLMSIGESATLRHVHLSGGSAGRHCMKLQQAEIASNATYDGFVLATSAALCREAHIMSLQGRGASGGLHGLYLAQKGAQSDIWCRIEHMMPDTTSRATFKGIVAEHGEATFNGYVYVERDAQKTDSALYNKNLLLSKRARINTRPQLEIYADDVKCAHGSTVGQLDEKQLFYLTARGLPPAEARAMLIDAFGRDVLDDCPVEDMRESLEGAISSTIASMVES